MTYNVFSGTLNPTQSINQSCGRLDFIDIAFQRKLKFLNGLYQVSGLVIKECFRYVRYDAKFKKLCEDCDVLIDNGCLRFDIYSQFTSLCSV